MKGYLFRPSDWVRGYSIQDVQNGKMGGEPVSRELFTINADGTIEMMSTKCSPGPYICNNYGLIPQEVKIPERIKVPGPIKFPDEIKVFYAYDEKDRDLGDNLKKQLYCLRKEVTWIWDYYADISAGKVEIEEIDFRLNNANLILLLISASFINSKYYEHIIKRAVEKQERGEARTVPIILRPVKLEGTPFTHLKTLPTEKKSITNWRNRDKAYENVADGIMQVIKELNEEKFFYLNFYQQGEYFKGCGRYQEALAAYEQVFRSKPEFGKAYKGKGDVHFELGNYQEAFAAYEQAIHYNPTDSYAIFLKAIVLSKLGRYAESRLAIDEAIGLDQKNAIAHFGKAMILYQLGELNEARIAYNLAVAIDPEIRFVYIHYENAFEVSEIFIEAMQEPNPDVNTIPPATSDPSSSEDSDIVQTLDPTMDTMSLASSDLLPLPSEGTNIVRPPDSIVSPISPATPGPLPLQPAASQGAPARPRSTPITPDRLPLLPAITGPMYNPRTGPLGQTPYLPSWNSSPTVAGHRSRAKIAMLLILVLFVITASVLIYSRIRTSDTRIVHVSSYSIPFSNITASFYANPHDSGTFDLAPSTRLDVSPQSFSTIAFNPDLKTVHCVPALTVDTKIRLFRDITKNADGSCTITVAHDKIGQLLGIGDRSNFEAVFIASISVKSAGSLLIHIDSDDGWILSIGRNGNGNQPKPDKNILKHPADKTNKTSPNKHYLEMGDYNIPSSTTQVIKVNFTDAGTYPVEIDYTECCGGPLTLVVTNTFTPS